MRKARPDPKTFVSTVSIGLLTALLVLLPACSVKSDVRLSRNLGDLLIAKLDVGMTTSEVDDVLAEQKKYLLSEERGLIKSEQSLYSLYQDNYYPRDFLNLIQVGARYRLVSYWTNYAGRNSGVLLLFFDEVKQTLIGWVNTASASALNNFMHERLTSQLRWSSNGLNKGMTHAQVHAVLGEPTEVITPPKESRAIYENYFWVMSPLLDGKNQKIEVYRYKLSNGNERSVYLIYCPAADELNSWGYDYAGEEADRYLREQQAQKN
jgi:hypothetical protein